MNFTLSEVHSWLFQPSHLIRKFKNINFEGCEAGFHKHITLPHEKKLLPSKPYEAQRHDD